MGRSIKKTGRKSKYDTHVKPRFHDIKKWLKRGANDAEIIKALGIGKSAFYDYLKKYPEFSEYLKTYRVDAVEEIKSAMFKKAIGFDYKEKETTIQNINFDDFTKGKLEEVGINVSELTRPELIKTKITTKHSLPDTTAGLILLKHWAKEEGWTGDPQSLELKKQEFEHKKKMDKENSW